MHFKKDVDFADAVGTSDAYFVLSRNRSANNPYFLLVAECCLEVTHVGGHRRRLELVLIVEPAKTNGGAQQRVERVVRDVDLHG